MCRIYQVATVDDLLYICGICWVATVDHLGLLYMCGICRVAAVDHLLYMCCVCRVVGVDHLLYMCGICRVTTVDHAPIVYVWYLSGGGSRPPIVYV